LRLKDRDWHLIIFFLNAVFVIVGYAINTYTKQAFLGPMKALRMGFIGLGLLLLLIYFINKPSKWKYYGYEYLGLGLAIFTGIFFSYQLSYSLNKVITFLFPFLYISLLFAYLKSQYTIPQIGLHLSKIFQLTYFIPVLVLVFLERGALGSTDISKSVGVFVKNHYGWATCMFLLLSADLLTNYQIGKWHRRLTYLAIPIAAIILLGSGSRSAWVSTLLATVVMLVRYDNISAGAKIFIIAAGVLAVSYFLADSNSAFYARWDKTQQQLDAKEEASGRYQWAFYAYQEFREKPTQWLTGRGLFDYKGLIHAGGYHNSYFEILFGCGVFVFSYFIFLFVLRPAYFFFRYYSQHFITFFPLLIIPFFESNLTGGQFLFYPWFSYMMFYGINPVKKEKEDKLRMGKIQSKKIIAKEIIAVVP